MNSQNSMHDEHAHFHEIQRFRQWWLWGLLILIQAIVLFSVMQGDKTGIEDVFYFPILIPLLIMWLLYVVRLETKIDKRGVAFRWRPFMKNFRTFEWQNISEASVLEYSFFIGYGLRLSMKHGTVHNIAGKWGIQIVLKNGSKYMFGTQKPDEARLALEKSSTEYV